MSMAHGNLVRQDTSVAVAAAALPPTFTAGHGRRHRRVDAQITGDWVQSVFPCERNKTSGSVHVGRNLYHI